MAKRVLIVTDRIGRGDDELGRVLMKNFLYSLARNAEKPAAVMLMNEGVRLACDGLGLARRPAAAGRGRRRGQGVRHVPRLPGAQGRACGRRGRHDAGLGRRRSWPTTCSRSPSWPDIGAPGDAPAGARVESSAWTPTRCSEPCPRPTTCSRTRARRDARRDAARARRSTRFAALIEDARARLLGGEEFAPDVSLIARDAARPRGARGAAQPAARHQRDRHHRAHQPRPQRAVGARSGGGRRRSRAATRRSSTTSRAASAAAATCTCESLLCRLTGAEAAMAVNNNAAAVMLGIAALARGKEAVVSRGQLVEIGGSFRIPDIMRESGATMVEVGTTNKTHLADYERAMTAQHRALPQGALEQLPRRRLHRGGRARRARRARRAARRSPSWRTRARACSSTCARSGCPDEPTVAESVAAGAAVVTASGDKLLGGPQAGLICGRHDVIARLKKHPMARALRLDKMTLAALEATLFAYLDETRALREIPTLRMLTMPVAEVRARAEALAARLRTSLGERRRGRPASTRSLGPAAARCRWPRSPRSRSPSRPRRWA